MRFVLAAAAALFPLGPACAKTVVVDQVVEPIRGFGFFASIRLAQPLDFNAGDTIDLTFRFDHRREFGAYQVQTQFSGVQLANGNNLSLSNPGSVVYELLNADGDFEPTGPGHLEQGIGLLPLPIGSPTHPMTGSFDGVRLVYQVTGDRSGNLGIAHLSFYFQSGPVPEPASWTMMLGGFGLAGMAFRRRSRRNRGCLI